MTQTEQIRKPASLADITHGVHVECQTDRAEVTAVCGYRMGWEDEAEGNRKGFCVVCLDLLVCPICGSKVKAPL